MTSPSVSAGRHGACGTFGGMKNVSPSRMQWSTIRPSSQVLTTMSPFSWMKNSSLSTLWKSFRAFGPPMTIAKKSRPL